MDFFQKFADEFTLNFIEGNRWKYILTGLGNTLLITLAAVVLGILIGCVVAIIRSTHDTTGKFKIGNAICRVYLTIIRGTPTMIQLLIIYFVIFGSVNVPKLLVAILSFGINSGAYVAEIFRGGIMSIDKGQNEAGRSLGLTYAQTMIHIIIPQALKASLPALCNEFIVLLKETSIGVYISLPDLTYAGNLIRSQTYSAFMPLIAIAIIYLALVMLLTFLFNKLERRLRKSEH
ncbi:MAG: amino acid ABC transporter permease [Acutalibacteraceae bacterium]